MIMQRQWRLAATACAAIVCTWLVGHHQIQADEQDQEVRIEVQVDASEEGQTNTAASEIQQRVVAMAAHAHDDLEEKLEGILKEAGLEGDNLKEALAEVLEACKESCGAGAIAIRRIQMPQIRVIGPDGKQQKIQLRALGSAASAGGEANEELTEKIREKVDQALKNSGLDDKQLEQVRKALERVEQLRGAKVPMFESHKLHFGEAAVPDEYKYMIGIACSPLNDALRSDLKLADGQGLVVVKVLADTPAEKAGVKEGDVLLKAAGKSVAGIRDLIEAVQTAGKDEKKLALQLNRDGKKENVQIAPVERESLRGSVEAEIGEEALENLRQHLPDIGKHGFYFGDELGPGVIAPSRTGKADDQAVKALKKQVETLNRQVKELQAELKKLKADKD
jgi:hypothetical protein